MIKLSFITVTVILAFLLILLIRYWKLKLKLSNTEKDLIAAESEHKLLANRLATRSRLVESLRSFIPLTNAQIDVLLEGGYSIINVDYNASLNADFSNRMFTISIRRGMLSISPNEKEISDTDRAVLALTYNDLVGNRYALEQFPGIKAKLPGSWEIYFDHRPKSDILTTLKSTPKNYYLKETKEVVSLEAICELRDEVKTPFEIVESPVLFINSFPVKLGEALPLHLKPLEFKADDSYLTEVMLRDLIKQLYNITSNLNTKKVNIKRVVGDNPNMLLLNWVGKAFVVEILNPKDLSLPNRYIGDDVVSFKGATEEN